MGQPLGVGEKRVPCWPVKAWQQGREAPQGSKAVGEKGENGEKIVVTVGWSFEGPIPLSLRGVDTCPGFLENLYTRVV